MHRRYKHKQRQNRHISETLCPERHEPHVLLRPSRGHQRCLYGKEDSLESGVSRHILALGVSARLYFILWLHVLCEEPGPRAIYYDPH